MSFGPDGFHDQRIAILPVADGIAEPSFDGIGVVLAAIQKDLAPDARPAFIHNNKHFVGLNHGPGIAWCSCAERREAGSV